jgi:hypothetical protein
MSQTFAFFGRGGEYSSCENGMERVRFAGGGGGVFIDQETLKLTRCGCVPQVSLGRIGAQKERQMLKIKK